MLKIWEDRKVFGKSGSKTVHQLIEEADLAQEGGPANGGASGGDELLQKKDIVASIGSLIQKAEKAAEDAKKLNQIVEQISGVAPDEQNGAELLEGLVEYRSALVGHKESLEELKSVLDEGLQMQDRTINEVASAIAACEVRIAAVRQLNTNSTVDKSNADIAIEEQNPLHDQGGAAVEAGIVSESAQVAAQIMANPGALLEALAAAIPVHGKQEATQRDTSGGSPAEAQEEYDPEDPF